MKNTFLDEFVTFYTKKYDRRTNTNENEFTVNFFGFFLTWDPTEVGERGDGVFPFVISGATGTKPFGLKSVTIFWTSLISCRRILWSFK